MQGFCRSIWPYHRQVDWVMKTRSLLVHVQNHNFVFFGQAPTVFSCSYLVFLLFGKFKRCLLLQRKGCVFKSCYQKTKRQTNPKFITLLHPTGKLVVTFMSQNYTNWAWWKDNWISYSTNLILGHLILFWLMEFVYHWKMKINWSHNLTMCGPGFGHGP